MNVEATIAETATKAKHLLFDKDGKPKGHEYFLAELTLHTVLRPAESVQPGLGRTLIEWHGRLFVYDAGIAALFLDDAYKGDHTADRILCNTAAVVLGMNGGISDLRLRKYAAERLSGDIHMPDRRRGRSSIDNAYRDAVIAGRLIPPLLASFKATRNEATFGKECACSIVSSALGRVGIKLSERRIAELWAKVSDRFVVADK
jgi:hypothetical protein